MDKNDSLCYVRWMDNPVVTMISTSCDVTWKVQTKWTKILDATT